MLANLIIKDYHICEKDLRSPGNLLYVLTGNGSTHR